MKTKYRMWIYLLTLTALGLILTHCCLVCKEEASGITDIDGNVYDTITIGTQTWMVQNLKTTRYRNGDLIGTTSPATLNISTISNAQYQWAYDGKGSNVATYGRLYTWYTATDSRGVCPTGWHVPSNGEWTTLETFLGGGSVAGGKLKEIGTSHWNSPNTGATDYVGFSGLPGGWRDFSAFEKLDSLGYWWSTSEFMSGFPLSRGLFYDRAELTVILGVGVLGNSIRCLKDY